MDNILQQSHQQDIIGFPEGQLILTDLSSAKVAQVSEAYRNRKPLPKTGDEKADRIIEGLKTTTYYQNQ